MISSCAALLVFAACGGGDDGTGPDGSTSDRITVANNSFTPSQTTVPRGTVVTWEWVANSFTHNVTFQDGTASPNQNAGSYTRTFNTAGTYNYQCTIHGASMSGSVVVR